MHWLWVEHTMRRRSQEAHMPVKLLRNTILVHQLSFQRGDGFKFFLLRVCVLCCEKASPCGFSALSVAEPRVAEEFSWMTVVGWEYSSVMEHLPSMSSALSVIPRRPPKRVNTFSFIKTSRILIRWHDVFENYNAEEMGCSCRGS